MVRSAILLLSLAAAASLLLAPASLAQAKRATGGLADPVFSPLPFQAWLTQSEQTRIRWTTRVSAVELTNYQRLSARIEIEVDGAELAKRGGKGQFLMLLQFSDDRGCIWQYHQSIDLARVSAGIKNNNALYSQRFFFLPGDYRLAIAVYDTATEEHSIVKRSLHVSPLKNDPLPEAWLGLPAVESMPELASPSEFYLPFATRLHLAVAPRHPVEIDLVVNLTPSERLSGSSGALNRNLSFLLPIFKVVSQMEWRDAVLNVALLDLAHRRVAFQQDHVHRIEWRRAQRSLAEINPGVIDVQTLENRRFNANFFLSEIGRRIREPIEARPRVVIVLSSPVEFQAGQELNPIDLKVSPDFRIYYFRYQPQLQPVIAGRPVGRRGWAQTRRLPQRPAAPDIDELEPLLRPVAPRLYDVTTPDQVRRALAGMMAEIGKM